MGRCVLTCEMDRKIQCCNSEFAIETLKVVTVAVNSPKRQWHCPDEGVLEERLMLVIHKDQLTRAFNGKFRTSFLRKLGKPPKLNVGFIVGTHFSS